MDAIPYTNSNLDTYATAAADKYTGATNATAADSYAAAFLHANHNLDAVHHTNVTAVNCNIAADQYSCTKQYF